ncbi:MAG: hypothetical protein IT536_04875 [Hyphomicrobiales bacterium]|nr:hypothetical protein [Hyphomicrobiales bacterium]
MFTTASAQTVPPASAPQPMSPQAMDKRLHEQAALIQKVNPVGADRVVVYDLRWPKDADEYKALGKNALLLIGAVTRNKKELPVKKVYLRIGEKDIVLRRVFSKRTELSAASSVAKLFGAFREDALFVVPIGSLLASGTVFADFALNRTEFRLNSAPPGAPAFVKADTDKGEGSDPSPDTLKTILARDYPGYPSTPERPSRR